MAKNNCRWLKIGSTDRCGKSCIGEYCHIHNARLKKSPETNKPCIHCGKGTKNKYMVCRGCGYHTVYIKYWLREKRAAKKAEAKSEVEAKNETETNCHLNKC